MKHFSTLLAAALVAGTLAAQTSSTLPKGFDTTEGAGAGFWSGWTPNRTATIKGTPARTVYLFGSSSFPWGKAAKRIGSLSVRRDGTTLAGSTTALTNSMRVFVSSNGATSGAHPDLRNWEGNHGRDKALVVGTTAAPAAISFPATAKPTAGRTAAFNATMAFARPFVVPAGAKTMTIEIRNYKLSATTGNWMVDQTSLSNSFSSAVVTITPGSTACVTPSMGVWNMGHWVGSSFLGRYDTKLKGKIGIGLLGTPLATGVTVPGTGTPGCKVFVNAALFLVTAVGISDQTTNGRLQLNYGKVPDIPGAAGFTVAHQALVFGFGTPAGFALSRSLNVKIGGGYPSTVPHTMAYSYWNRTTGTGTLVDPDKEPWARFISDDNVIFQVR